MKLNQFEKELKEIMNKYEKPRPFVCEGNPLESEIFIVGVNAATEMKASFWDFWIEGEGFNKEEWFETYKKERAAKPLKEGKKSRRKVSATRNNIEIIVDGLRPVKCVETNLYVKASSQASDLKKKDKDGSIFNFLLESIKPKIVVVHGSDAIKYMSEITKSKIEQDKKNIAKINNVETIIYATLHLSRMSKENSKQLAMNLNKELSS